MSSSVSLLPTIEFLEQIASVQFGTESSYGVGFSKLKPDFFSTTNSEYLCLNSESEFLTSSIENIKIKNPFEYSRSNSSPIHVAINNLSVKSKVLNNTKSIFLYRLNGANKEIITVSNFDKNPDNITTAPLIDCFSRECLTWFSSDIDWFVGFGESSQSLTSFVVNNEGVILTKSLDILDKIIPDSTKAINHTNIQVLNTVSTFTPWVEIQLSTGASLSSQLVESSKNNNDQANMIFLFSVENNDSMVAFAGEYTIYDSIKTKISFSSDDVIII